MKVSLVLDRTVEFSKPVYGVSFLHDDMLYCRLEEETRLVDLTRREQHHWDEIVDLAPGLRRHYTFHPSGKVSCIDYTRISLGSMRGYGFVEERFFFPNQFGSGGLPQAPAWSPCGRYFACSFFDGHSNSVHWVDLESGTHHDIDCDFGFLSLQFAPDGRCLVGSLPQTLRTHYDMEQVFCWHFPSGERKARWKLPSSNYFMISPDGTLVVRTCGFDLVLLDLDTGRELMRRPSELPSWPLLEGFHPGGRFFAMRRPLVFCHTTTLKELARFDDTDDVRSVDFSPDGRQVAWARGNQVDLYRLEI